MTIIHQQKQPDKHKVYVYLAVFVGTIVVLSNKEKTLSYQILNAKFK